MIRGVVGRKDVFTLPNGRVVRRITVFDGRDGWELSVADGLIDSIQERQEYDFLVRPRQVGSKLVLEVESVRPAGGQKINKEG